MSGRSLARGNGFALLFALWLPLAVTPCAAQHEPDAHAEARDTYYAIAESNGSAQSPIDIRTSGLEPAHHQVALHYRPSNEHILNLGHTIEAEFERGSVIEYDGLSYELKQLHFHTPAEHLVDGITYPMELHIVHTLENDPEKYLVIGILFREGEANGLIAQILGDVPAEPGARFDGRMQIDVRDVLPSVEGHYHYEGSLTTPPYSETVTWLVLKGVRQASAEQVQLLNRLEGDNARHIQDVYGRHVEEE